MESVHPVWKPIWQSPSDKIYDYFYIISFEYNKDDGTTSIICNVDPHIVEMVSDVLQRHTGFSQFVTIIESELVL